MSIFKLKKVFFILIFSIINFFTAFFITTSLGLENTIILRTMSLLYGDITYEVVIFVLLAVIESSIYQFKQWYFWYK